MRKYIKPSVKLIDMKDELCDIGLNGSGGDGEQLGKDNATFDDEQGAETAQPRSVWDD
jgi:hypothetical protein